MDGAAPANGHSAPPPTAVDRQREECLNVQRTNDESCVSKRSAAKQGYFPDTFLRYFVRKPSRRCPLINRGYYARLMAVRSIQQAFLTATASQPRQCLSLGAGFDTSYFHWRSQPDGVPGGGDCVFFEVDYPTLVERKKCLILEQEPLRSLLTGTPAGDAATLTSDGYRLFGCDLRAPATLHGLLRQHGFDFARPTLVLAECFLQYLQPEDSDALIAWVQAHVPRCLFVAFEQMEGGDAFGAVMQANLRQRGSPLYGLAQYNTVADQEARYCRLQFSSVAAVDLHRWYHALLPAAEQRRVEALEPFDEWEDWRVTCSHYCAVLAVNRAEDSQRFGCRPFMEPPPVDEPLPERPWPGPAPPLWGPEVHDSVFSGWGHSCCEWTAGGALVIFGGFFSGGRASAAAARTNQLLLYRPAQGSVRAVPNRGDAPPPRMCHAACMTRPDTMVVFGGRTNPSCGLNDLYTLDVRRQEWAALQRLGTEAPAPRWRHTLTALGPDGAAVLFGGRAAAATGGTAPLGDAWLLECDTSGFARWSRLSFGDGSAPPPRCSHVTLALADGTVLVHGGLDEGNCPLDDTWVLSVDVGQRTGHWVRLNCQGPRLFAHAAVLLGDAVLVLGGLSDAVRPPPAHRLCLATRQWSVLPLPPPPTSDRHPGPPLFAHHRAGRLGRRVALIGGGAVCFSFGTAYTPTYCLEVEGSDAETEPVVAPDPNMDTPVHSATSSPPSLASAPPDSPPQPAAIRRMRGATEADWLQAVGQRVPTLFEACDIGPCVSLWTPEYLAAKEANTTVSVHRCAGTDKLDFLKKNFDFVSLTFADLVNATLGPNATERLYFRSVGVHQTPSDFWRAFPAIGPDFSVPPIMRSTIRPDVIHQSVLRVSAPHLHMWMHYDIPDNILCQVRGTKRVVLFPPSEVRNVYLKGSVSEVMDIDEPDQPDFPLFAKAHAARIEFTMNEGDVLFLPALWLHSTVAETASISLNVFFRHLPEDQYDHKDIYGNKDLLVAQRARQEALRLRDTLQAIPHYYRDFYKQQLLQLLEDT